MRRSRAPRALRGLIGASVATFIALVPRGAGGGALPGWIGIAVPWVLSVMVCTLLAGRALSLWRLALAVTISQLLFHTLFVLGFVASGLSTGGQSAHAGHGSHSAQLLMPLPATAVSALPPDATMLLWHCRGRHRRRALSRRARPPEAARVRDGARRLGSAHSRDIRRASPASGCTHSCNRPFPAPARRRPRAVVAPATRSTSLRLI